MSTASVPKRGRRYTSLHQAKARQLADGGWLPSEIVRLMRDDGVEVTEQAVRMWVRPMYAEKQRANDRAYQARRRAAANGGRVRGNFGAAFIYARLIALHDDAGMFPSQIAKVLNFDFGLTLTESMVRYAITTRTPPRELRRLGVPA